MRAGSKLLLNDSLAACSAAYGFGHLQAINSTHLYWEFVQSAKAASIKGPISTQEQGDLLPDVRLVRPRTFLTATAQGQEERGQVEGQVEGQVDRGQLQAYFKDVLPNLSLSSDRCLLDELMAAAMDSLRINPEDQRDDADDYDTEKIKHREKREHREHRENIDTEAPSLSQEGTTMLGSEHVRDHLIIIVDNGIHGTRDC